MRKIRNIERLKAKFDSSKITREGLRRLLQSGVLGRVTGVIGPWVVRYQGDKLIISRRPLLYNTSQTAASIAVRNNFASEIRLARELNSVNILKKLWKESSVKGISPYHKMIFCNKMKQGLPSAENTITPPGNQLHYDNLCSLNADYSINISENARFENDDSLIIIVVPYDPVHKSSPTFEIIKLEIMPSSGSPLQLNKEQICLLKRYRKYLLYSAAVRIEGNSVLWSNTVCIKGGIITEHQMVLISLVLLRFMLYSLNSGSKVITLRNIRDG